MYLLAKAVGRGGDAVPAVPTAVHQGLQGALLRVRTGVYPRNIRRRPGGLHLHLGQRLVLHFRDLHPRQGRKTGLNLLQTHPAHQTNLPQCLE